MFCTGSLEESAVHQRQRWVVTESVRVQAVAAVSCLECDTHFCKQVSATSPSKRLSPKVLPHAPSRPTLRLAFVLACLIPRHSPRPHGRRTCKVAHSPATARGLYLARVPGESPAPGNYFEDDTSFWSQGNLKVVTRRGTLGDSRTPPRTLGIGLR